MRDTRFVKEINVTTWLPFFVLVISDACVIPIYKRESVPILMHFPIGIKKHWLCGSSDMHRYATIIFGAGTNPGICLV
jgi:hypothetical protein